MNCDYRHTRGNTEVELCCSKESLGSSVEGVMASKG